MSATHLIERLEIEIEFDPPDPELQAEQQLLRLVQDALLPVLDEVLDACDEPGTVLVLPAIALDLGRIERHAWRVQAPARLRALLEDAIAAARQQARLAAAPGCGSAAGAELPLRRSTAEEALARLAAFLRTGRMGWDAPLRRADLHLALLEGLLATERAALLRMLAGAALQPAMLRRLAEQFPQRLLETILDAAAPDQARALLAWRARLAAQTGGMPAAAWPLVLGVALGKRAPAVGLEAVMAALGYAPTPSATAALAPWERERLTAWWRRGERDAGAQDLLERLLNRGGGYRDELRGALARILGPLLASASGARSLMEALPLRLRERLLRFLAPGAGPRMLALAGEAERRLVARVGDRARAAEAHARCWQALLAAGLGASGGVVREDMLRARLYAMVDAAERGSALPSHVEPGFGGAATDAAEPDELSRFAAFLEHGRFHHAPGALEAAHEGRHVMLLERLLERAGGSDRLRAALLRTLDALLASPHALRRLVAQFPQRQLAGIVRAAAPGHAAALLTLVLETQDGARLLAPATDEAVREAWRRLLLRALGAHRHGPAPAPAQPDPDVALSWLQLSGLQLSGLQLSGLQARLDAWWRTARTGAAPAIEREALQALAARDGGWSLARALPERLREALLWYASPDQAPRAMGVLHRLHARAPGDGLERWAQLLAASLAPTASAAALQALCERLEAAHDGDVSGRPAPDAPELADVDDLAGLEAWWRNGQADAARAMRMERLLARATAAGAEPGLGRAVAAALARTVALPEGPRRLAAALPEQVGIALLWCVAPALAPRLVALMQELRQRLASRPGAYRDCWAWVYALCFSPAPSSAALDALCRRLDAVAPAGGAMAERAAGAAIGHGDDALDGLEAWWRAGYRDRSRATQLERLLASDAADPPGAAHAAARAARRDWLAAAVRRALDSPGGARRLVSALPEHLREALLARLAPGFAPAVVVRLRALGRWLASTPAAVGPAPGLHALCWAEVFETCLSPTVTAAAVQALCARLEALIAADGVGAPAAARQGAPGAVGAPGKAARAGTVCGVERLAAFLRRGRLLGARAAAGHAAWEHAAGAGQGVHETHVALLDALLAAPSQPLWRMLAAALGRQAQARRLVEQFPERQLRDVVARAAPAQAAALFALLDEVHAADAGAAEAARLRRLVVWPLLLAAAVRAAAGLSPFPGLKALRRQLARAAAPARPADLPPAAARNAAQWLARIRDHLERDGSLAPARRALMVNAIAAAAAAGAGAGERDFLRLVLLGLVRGDMLDLDDIARQASRPEAAAVAQAPGGQEMKDARPPDAIVAVLRPLAASRPEPIVATAPTATGQDGVDASGDRDGVPVGECIALNNAGMVLMAPYLPRLFGMLGLVADGVFVSLDAAERAVHLLQFAVSGGDSTPEYALPLNKLLCGLPLDAPVAAGIALTTVERETIEGLLEALIGAWSALGRTSVDGLRQSFLMRDGDLVLGPQGWELSVAHGPFDMLMDRLPWSFSIVRFGWMAAPLHVTWH